MSVQSLCSTQEIIAPSTGVGFIPESIKIMKKSREMVQKASVLDQQ
jgi:hypothetical protein